MANAEYRESQPGLEVGYQSDQYPSPTKYYDEGKHAVQYTQLYSYKPPENAAGLGVSTGPPQKRLTNRMKWIIVGVVGVVLIVVAGVIGGVIGSKMKGSQKATEQDQKSGNGGGGGENSANSTASIPTSKLIQANSSLTATGYRFGTDYMIQLFYQGSDDKLRYSLYQSNFDKWTDPLEVNAAAVKNTPMAASQILVNVDSSLPPIHQTEFFFAASPRQLGGQNWRDGFTAGGLPDSINRLSFSLPPVTRLAAYWPSIIWQDSNNAVNEVFYNYTSNRFDGPQLLPITPSPNSALLALPREVSHTAGKPGQESMRLVYRDGSGRLSTYDRLADGNDASSAGSLPVTISPYTAISGFATARPGTTNAVNTYILYQTEGGTIEYMYQDDGTGWKGPDSDPAFQGADKPTQIACVTAAAMASPNVPLSSSNDISHCFFQVGKALKQVQFDGSKWIDLGYVPIP